MFSDRGVLQAFNEELSAFIFKLNRMEQEPTPQKDNCFPIQTLTLQNINLILAFLDPSTITNIARTTSKQQGQRYNLVSIAKITNFLNQYLQKTDRSLYLPFYAEPALLCIEQQQVSHLTSHSFNCLSLLSDSCQTLFQRLNQELSTFELGQEAVQSIMESLTDPQFPFPKLRKQDIGVHCNSPFQFFLVDKLFPNSQEEEMEEMFEQLRNYLDVRWVDISISDKRQLEIIEEVFESWFKISYQNYPQFLLPGRPHHNLVVLMVALLDLFVDSFSFYIQSIDDPFYSFTQFNMRFCVFRNTLLSLEEKLGFLFKSYSLFCREVLKEKNHMEMDVEGQDGKDIREMTIWHCGMSKWYIYMQQLHQGYFSTFFFLLKKNNLNSIRQNISEKLAQNAVYIELQNRLQLKEHDLLEWYKTFEVASPIEDIFDQDPSLYQQVIKEYIEYIVDISINQYSVHWCGHSGHLMHVPYQEFDHLMIQNYKRFISQLRKVADTVSNPSLAFDSMLSSMIDQLDKQYLKPVTLKKINDLVKNQAMKLTGQDNYKHMALCQSIVHIGEEIEGRDKVLDHFNENAGISNEISYKYSIVLDNEDFNKMLKTSASTNASSSGCKRPPHLLKMQGFHSSDSIVEGDLF